MEAKGEEKLERQRQAPEGACLPPRAAGRLPLTPLCPLLTPIPPQPASVNRIQKVTQSPGSEFLEDPGWELLVAGGGGEAERAQIKIRYPQPSHIVGGGGRGGSRAVCLLKPGLSTGFSSWMPGKKVLSPESLRNGNLIRPRWRVNLTTSPGSCCFHPGPGRRQQWPDP